MITDIVAKHKTMLKREIMREVLTRNNRKPLEANEITMLAGRLNQQVEKCFNQMVIELQPSDEGLRKCQTINDQLAQRFEKFKISMKAVKEAAKQE